MDKQRIAWRSDRGRRRPLFSWCSAPAFVAVVALAACSVDPRSAEGHTHGELIDGVMAEADHYILSWECFATGELSVDGRVSHNLQLEITNEDDQQRTFQLRIEREGEPWGRDPTPWLQPGEVDESTSFLGWQDDFPDGCPDHDVQVFRNPVEALVDTQ